MFFNRSFARRLRRSIVRRRFHDMTESGSPAGANGGGSGALLHKSLSRKAGDLAKRALDVVMASVGLLFLSPFFLLLAILIRRDSPGPVFYRGRRTGQGGKVFPILKFRTMYERPESYSGPQVTCKEDDRITPLGRWLRSTKINELPQLWNVLVGDMSLVGPRPEDPEIIQSWPEDVREEICSIRPGITSPASVLYHGEESLLSKADLMGLYFRDILPDKMRLDQLYVRNRSFLADLDIIFWTMALFHPGVAGNKIPEGYLFAGPLCRLIYRYISWFVVDLAVALAATAAAGFFWRSQGPLNWGIEHLAILAVAIAILFSGFNSLAGFNRIVWSHATAEDALGLVFSSSFITALLLVVNRLQDAYGWLPFPALPPPLIITIGLLAQLGFIMIRYRLRLLTGLAHGWLAWRSNVQGVGERVLIVGDGEGCEMADWLLKRGVFRHAFSIVGLVSSEDPSKQGMRLHGCWILGGIGDLSSLVKKFDIGIIVHAGHRMTDTVDSIVFEFCRTSKIQILFLRDLLEMYNLRQEHLAAGCACNSIVCQRPDVDPPPEMAAGLPGSLLLQDRVRHCFTNGRHRHIAPAVLFIELNGLASLRVVYGERMIDDIIAEAAIRLLKCKRNDDTLARYQDHQFVLLFENMPAERLIYSLARRIRASLSEPFALNGHRVRIGARIDCFSSKDVPTDLSDLAELDLGILYARRKSIHVFEAAPPAMLH